MGIFGWNGAAGLPPLDDDKRHGGKGDGQPRCRTRDCPRPVALNSRYCAQCGLARLRGIIQEGDALIEAWPDREATTHELPAVSPSVPSVPAIAAGEMVPPDLASLPRRAQELAAIRRYSAPLLDLDRDLDHRCRWCCHIMSEHTAVAALTGVRPTLPNFECERHRQRRHVWRDMVKVILLELADHRSSAEIAEDYTHGYLGDRLNPDEYF